MILTLGFTQSDDARGYTGFTHGYRTGELQHSVTITLEGDGRALSAQQWAAAAFRALNSPDLTGDHLAEAIRRAVTDQSHLPARSLSVGDTVTAHGQMWACEHSGWRRIDAATASA